MNLREIKIGDLIRIPDVETVIRLEADEYTISKAAATFVVTSDVEKHLHLIAESIKRPTGQGFFLQGDFGSGKSHFLSVLYAIFSRVSVNTVLNERHEELRRLGESGRIILPVAISLVHFRGSTPLESIILDAIEATLHRCGREKALTARGAVMIALRQSLGDIVFATEFARQAGIGNSDIIRWIDSHIAEAAAIAEPLLRKQKKLIPEMPDRDRKELFEAALSEVREAGYDGCFLLIDELSEFFRSKPDPAQLNDDARTLQLLGELTGTYPLWIIAAVQESVERTGDIAQATFRKIKDRFPVKLHLSTLHIRDLIEKRLIQVTEDGEKTIFRIYEEYRRHFPHIPATPRIFRSIYPVHLLTLELLEGLGELFSQHRGIVDFIHTQIGGDQSRGIAGILDRPCVELLAPDAIYNHFAGRIAEFSAFYLYPSQIVPHLDECIDKNIEDPEDRVIAKRLIRIIVLHAIHPTAKPPTARLLAELAASMLSFEEPDANAQYVAEVLLDPVVASSRFLVKKPSDTGSSADASYTVTTTDDQSKILEARINRVIGETSDDDSRLYIDPLMELPESYSWPGPSVWREPVMRSVTWRQTGRTSAVVVATQGQEEAVKAKLEALYAAGNADFGVVIAIGDCRLDCRYTAVWRVELPKVPDNLLKEHFACTVVLGELRPGNPADSPLIPLVKERLQKSSAAVNAFLLKIIYSGAFDDVSIYTDPSIKEVMRFERLLEIAGEYLCEKRYPNFREIAPTGLSPSLRLYHRLFEEFVIAGSISLRDARARGLTESIETLAVPLGLIEVKSGNYVLSPQTTNKFLSYLYSHLNPSAPRFRSEIMYELQCGPYGVPHDTACFLLASLAHCGLISFVNHGRVLPIDYIKLMTVDQVDAIAPGELINQADRDTILKDCSFLLPELQNDTFDLRRQRDAWAAAVKFKSTVLSLVESLKQLLHKISDYGAFRHFDFDGISSVADRFSVVANEIKVSYAAREGLERFTAAWRSSGLCEDDFKLLRQTVKFLQRQSERVVHVNHYCNHSSVITASNSYPEIGTLRNKVLNILENPLELLIPDEGQGLQAAFEQFRNVYAECYAAEHERFHTPPKSAPLSRQGERNLILLRRLAAVEALDRPPGVQQFLAALDKAPPRPCSRNVAEELLRSPICGCNFSVGNVQERHIPDNPTDQIDRLLNQYISILKSKEVVNALTAHSFAIRDIDPGTSKRLNGLYNLLKDGERISIPALADLLDERTVSEIARALAGYARIERRNLEELRNNLAGRRLNAARIRKIVEDWIGAKEDDIIFSIGDNAESATVKSAEPVLWPRLHPNIFGSSFYERNSDPGEISALGELLERRFPAGEIARKFNNVSTADLLSFICMEPVHRSAIAAAWGIVAKRVCSDKSMLPDNTGTVQFLDKTEAFSIERRFSILKAVGKKHENPFPERLTQRPLLAAIYNDPWADASVKKAVLAAIANITAAGADWFSTLPPVETIDCGDRITVIIIDAIPPDVWLMADAKNPSLFASGRRKWVRSSGACLTIEGINELFGFPKERDPLEEFSQRKAAYASIEGNEEYGWTEQLREDNQESAQVLHVALFDRQVHDGFADLNLMAEKLGLLLQRNLPLLLDRCRKTGHKLILTTDHGLTFSEKGLNHGAGGLFEQTIFRFEWEQESFIR